MVFKNGLSATKEMPRVQEKERSMKDEKTENANAGQFK